MIVCVQDLGEPILSIPDAIKADSYYEPPGSGSFTGGRVCVGAPDKALQTAPHTIKGGRCAPANTFSQREILKPARQNERQR